MGKPRITRSKTGCQACRRRKVRCDEKKPICSACRRLELGCSYQPGPGTSSPGEASRYRVRFVNTSWPGQNPTSSSATDTPDKNESRSPSASRRPTRRDDQSDEDTDSRLLTTVSGLHQDHGAAPSSVELVEPHRHDFAAEQMLEGSSVVIPPHMVNDAAHMNAGSLPVYFDLNMNFDVLGEEWLVFPHTAPPEASISDTTTSPVLQSHEADDFPSPQNSAVVIDNDDHGLIQHYLNVMTQYTKVRGPGDENIYTQIFSNMALFYAPLYNAIMAWTALHLGQTKPETNLAQKAEQRYSHAISLMHRDQDVAHHFELSLVTIWFALQFELLAARGIDSFCRHLEFTADLVDAHRRHQKAGGDAVALGHIGARVLIWLGTYDARASWVGGTGRLLQNLELFCADYDFLDAAFSDMPSGTGSPDLKPFLRLTRELDTVEGRIVHLHRREVAPPAAIWSAAQSDLLSIQERLESSADVAPFLAAMFDSSTRSITKKINTATFNYLLLLGACYSLIISFHRSLPATTASSLRGKLIAADMAAARIVRISSWVNRLRPPSPQNIWPGILFRAGIETTDLVYQEWVVKQFTEAETWGANFRKTRVLLEQVLKRQSREGTRVDYLDVMRRSMGLFII